jgi:putative transposase
LCLAAPVSGTQTTRDAIAAVRAAMEAEEGLLGTSLLEDCLDRRTGEIHLVVIVSDNGPAYKSTDFLLFIASRPELLHVRTRHHAPETDGVVERFNESPKYEHLYREEIADAQVLVEQAERFRQIYNEVRPHEALGFRTPAVVHLAEPNPFQAESVQKT